LFQAHLAFKKVVKPNVFIGKFIDETIHVVERVRVRSFPVNLLTPPEEACHLVRNHCSTRILVWLRISNGSAHENRDNTNNLLIDIRRVDYHEEEVSIGSLHGVVKDKINLVIKTSVID